MSKQRILDEARALEPTCAVASSPAARSFKAGLRKLDVATQAYHLSLYCQADYVALVRCALAIGISANSVGTSGTPLLCRAALNGAARSLKALLEAGADVRLTARDGSSALHCASAFGHTECVRLLLKAKAPVDATNKDGTTPLMCAAYEGHREIVKFLLTAGASHRARDDYGNEPLHEAARGGASATIQLLLSAGADANATNICKNTPMVEAIFHQHYLAVCELVPVTDLSIATRQGRKALHVCAEAGTAEILDLLLPYVTDLDAGTVAGGIHPDGSPETVFNLTALQLGCTLGQHAMVKKLVRLGASRTALNSLNVTALRSSDRLSELRRRPVGPAARLQNDPRRGQSGIKKRLHSAALRCRLRLRLPARVRHTDPGGRTAGCGECGWRDAADARAGKAARQRAAAHAAGR